MGFDLLIPDHCLSIYFFKSAIFDILNRELFENEL